MRCDSMHHCPPSFLYFLLQIWNHMNGECLHVMLCSGSTEVTGVVHLPDRALFLSAGWNKRIVSFNDKSDVRMYGAFKMLGYYNCI